VGCLEQRKARWVVGEKGADARRKKKDKKKKKGQLVAKGEVPPKLLYKRKLPIGNRRDQGKEGKGSGETSTMKERKRTAGGGNTQRGCIQSHFKRGPRKKLPKGEQGR